MKKKIKVTSKVKTLWTKDGFCEYAAFSKLPKKRPSKKELKKKMDFLDKLLFS